MAASSSMRNLHRSISQNLRQRPSRSSSRCPSSNASSGDANSVRLGRLMSLEKNQVQHLDWLSLREPHGIKPDGSRSISGIQVNHQIPAKSNDEMEPAAPVSEMQTAALTSGGHFNTLDRCPDKKCFLLSQGSNQASLITQVPLKAEFYLLLVARGQVKLLVNFLQFWGPGLLYIETELSTSTRSLAPGYSCSSD